MRRAVRIPVEMGTISERWTLGYLVDVILTRDAWLHRVDLCRAVGAEMVLTPQHDGRIVADVAAEWARRHGSPFRLELLGAAGGRFVSGDGRDGGDGGEGDEGCRRYELDAVEFCRILSGRATGDGLLATAVPF